MQPLTEAERVYRRGALQVIEYLQDDLRDLSDCDIRDRLSSWVEELRKGRDSLAVGYLGTYLDTVRSEVCKDR